MAQPFGIAVSFPAATGLLQSRTGSRLGPFSKSSRRVVHGGGDGRLHPQRRHHQILVAIDEHGAGHADPWRFRLTLRRPARLAARRAGPATLDAAAPGGTARAWRGRRHGDVPRRPCPSADRQCLGRPAGLAAGGDDGCGTGLRRNGRLAALAGDRHWICRRAGHRAARLRRIQRLLAVWRWPASPVVRYATSPPSVFRKPSRHCWFRPQQRLP